ncbi:dTDP-4-dehydrorhamnose reductase [Facklamia miroungae]|uniref:dTDP-4-dehydrorhamnose reductase n=1 Tax=Facklamia miroungae TaxID=120956 RepID=A0A1G7PHQ3_9LACT|nr:dTDP-4-dehydrorhamnose reductase [Facklamia miroungae]NKZ28715.1 dTDP-4-dehydrorhamnose reductase [Facklamia miroungae]SDF85761.1 dTDP-4-dehydrorhamnose reductase/dTDP-4-dehydrorhamnose 3,5-epimerase [Facklamia miroungae]
MNIIKTDIDGVLILEPQIFGDHRGWFAETYSKNEFLKLGIDIDFVQDNHSMSANKGTIRGLHFQVNPKAQTKLVRCTKGEILDVAVDLRKGSSTYKQWIGVRLSEENKKQLLVPKGFAHGFLTLSDHAEVQYKVDEYYAPEYDRSIRFDDPDISINWGIKEPILSKKDLKAPLLKDSDANFSIKFLVTGATGQLGHDVISILKERNFNVIAPTLEEFDLTERNLVKEYIKKEKPDVIVHCAAYTSVDNAEDKKDLCYSVNVDGTRFLAEAARNINAKVVYISTDYVFDGSGEKPHSEDEKTNPINYYGYTKEQGEKIVKEMLEKYFIVRTSWLYGINGNNFVTTMLRMAKTKSEIDVVHDQIGSPTYTKDLANFIVDLVQTNNYGTYHGVNEGNCSWYEFAQSIYKNYGFDIVVNGISTEDYATKAKRPLNSRLSKENTDKARIKRLPHWEDGLKRFLSEFKEDQIFKEVKH